MKVSTKGRYALRLMVDLGINGKEPNQYISLKDISNRQMISVKYLEQIATPLHRAGISNRQMISVKYLEQIVTPLHRAGLVRSIRGAQGGYRLSRSPERYSAGEILRAIEGSFAPIACLETEHNECEMYSQCPTVGFWEGMYKVITEYVDGVTLQQLIDEHLESLSGGCTEKL